MPKETKNKIAGMALPPEGVVKQYVITKTPDDPRFLKFYKKLSKDFHPNDHVFIVPSASKIPLYTGLKDGDQLYLHYAPDMDGIEKGLDKLWEM